MSFIKNNSGWKIKTRNGYEVFDGIRKVKHDSYLTFTFSNNSTLSCSLDHKIRVTNGNVEYWEFAKNIRKEYHGIVNLQLDKPLRIVHVDYFDESVELYDIVNSGDDYCYFSNGIVSHNCEFMGSSHTFLSSYALKNMVMLDPVFTYESLKLFELPLKDHQYVISVDVSRGKGLDKSAFSIIDVTEYPFKQVGTFYDNEISPLLFPTIISKVGHDYNDAFLLVENNDVGAQVVSILAHELEYDNIVSPQTKSAKMFEDGLRTTKFTKQVGCSTMRDLIEGEKLTVHCKNTHKEMTGFIIKGKDGSKKYQADSGYNDDLVMTLVNFSYLTTCEEFEELQDNDLRKTLFEKRMKAIDDDVLPMAIIDDGVDNYDDDYSSNDFHSFGDGGLNSFY